MSLLTDLLSLSHVPRWAIVRHHRAQSVAEHSFNVTLIARELVGRLKVDDVRLDCITGFALAHDVDECVTGDIPSPAKKHFRAREPFVSGFTQVTLKEIQVVKLADLIEAHTWIAMNGLGPHAGQVADHLYEKVMAFAGALGWADCGAIIALVHEIISEAGRLRT